MAELDSRITERDLRLCISEEWPQSFLPLYAKLKPPRPAAQPISSPFEEPLGH